MKISNAKQIIPPSRTINGVEIFFYENSNIIDNQIILCGHEKKDEHKTTKLYYHVIGTNIYEMVLRDWCDSYKHGLEDAHINIVKTAQGYYYLSAESKPYHQGTGNINIETFKSKNLRTGWQWCPNLTIKPTSRSFENYSMSSPVNYYLGNNELLQMFECRGLKGTPDSWWIDGQYYAKVSYAIFDTSTDTIKRRATQPISNVNAVPDDLWFEDGWWKHSWHTHDKTDGWFGFVYKSREFDKGLVFDYKATLDGKTIGEIYFTNSNKVRFWHSNQQGMWEGILSQGTSPVIPIGEDMNFKATDLGNNKVLFEWTANENAHFEDDNGYFKTCGTEFNGEYVFINVRNATKFRARLQSGVFGDWVSLNATPIEPPIIPPSDNEAIKTELRSHLITVENELEAIRDLVEDL